MTEQHFPSEVNISGQASILSTARLLKCAAFVFHESRRPGQRQWSRPGALCNDSAQSLYIAITLMDFVIRACFVKTLMRFVMKCALDLLNRLRINYLSQHLNIKRLFESLLCNSSSSLSLSTSLFGLVTATYFLCRSSVRYKYFKGTIVQRRASGSAG